MRVGEALELLDAGPILRRYFVINFFDGAVTTLGVLISAFLVGLDSALEVAIPVLGVGISMFTSGFLGSFFTELAERAHELKEMREQLLGEAEASYYEEASKIVSVVVGIVDGISPFLASAFGLLPLVIGHYLGREFEKAFYVSVATVFAEIFVLGAKLGELSGENPIVHGLKMLVIGVLTSILILVMGELLGVTPMRIDFISSEVPRLCP